MLTQVKYTGCVIAPQPEPIETAGTPPDRGERAWTREWACNSDRRWVEKLKEMEITGGRVEKREEAREYAR